VTVGLPVYNGARYLRESLTSILAQSFTDFEVVVTDNASSDRTGDICRELGARDPRVRYIRNDRNLGAAANYNRAFENARGRYFKWVAHDDAYDPTFLERCVATLEADEGAVACYSPAVFIDETGKVLDHTEQILDYTVPRPSERLRRWLFDKEDGWCHPVTGVIRTETLRRTRLIGPFVGSDVTLVGELLLHGTIRRTEERVFYRRDHAGRSTAAHRTLASLTEWFDTSARHSRAYMPLWRIGVEMSRAVVRVPMTPLEKIATTAIMARWFVRARANLTRELIRWAEAGRAPVAPPGQKRS
jgi:glycosyltransferase involved in cell wall biosynthesis